MSPQEDVAIILLNFKGIQLLTSFRWFGHAYPDKLSANILFDVTLLRDLRCQRYFLMPSRRTAGLSQMMAMRYGTAFGA